jgi:cytochrome c peroxidase
MQQKPLHSARRLNNDMNLHKAIFLLVLIVIWTGCSRHEIDPESQAYYLPVPEHFPQPVFDTQNPMTAEGIELGRMLFYDGRLSANNKVSCASCHQQELAFSDGVALSRAGVSATALLRHSPALINLAWANNGLFWDGGSTNLESQVFGPLTAHDEMAQNLYELIDELNSVPDYVIRFKSAFGNEISSQNVSKALAQFQRTLISADSKYDRFKLKKSGGTLTTIELKGLELVKQNCQGCHSSELFTDNEYHNNGLDSDFSNTEHEGVHLGRYRISYDLADLGKFRTPTLRNVELTSPYMHDGRLTSLEAVVEQYSTGIKESETLDPRLPAGGLKLAEDEKKAIVSFLKTLTDQTFIVDPKFKKP